MEQAINKDKTVESKLFKSLWDNLELQGDWKKTFGIIQSRYSEKLRYYHNLDHILTGLRELIPLKQIMSYSDPVEYAWWYHDIIYDVNEKDNEEKSAELAGEHGLKSGLSVKYLDIVRNCILATRHVETPKTIEEQVICDVDLSILAGDKAEFEKYERNIRLEYALLSDEVFKYGRKAVLEYFLSKEKIYHTDYFWDKYELKARGNIERSLLRLN